MSTEYESRRSGDTELDALRNTLDELSDTYDNEHISEAKEYVEDCADTDDPTTRASHLKDAYDELSKVEEGFEEYDRIEALRDGLDEIGDQYRSDTPSVRDPVEAYAKKKGEEILERNKTGIKDGAQQTIDESRSAFQEYRAKFNRARKKLDDWWDERK